MDGKLIETHMKRVSKIFQLGVYEKIRCRYLQDDQSWLIITSCDNSIARVYFDENYNAREILGVVENQLSTSISNINIRSLGVKTYFDRKISYVDLTVGSKYG